MSATEPETGETQPLYLVLADRLEAELSGLAPGTKLASEYDLVAAHGVSRLTARAALQELERRLVVRRVRGSGTFVSRRVDFAIGPGLSPSASEMQRRAGVVPTTVLVSVRTRRPPPAIRTLLDLDADDRVVSITRTGLVDSIPAWHGTTHVPHELAPELGEHLAAVGPLADQGGTSIIEVLRNEFGMQAELGWATADLAVLPSAIAAQLRVDGRPLAWDVEVGVWDRSLARAVALTQRWMRADVFRVRFETDQRVEAELHRGESPV